MQWQLNEYLQTSTNTSNTDHHLPKIHPCPLEKPNLCSFKTIQHATYNLYNLITTLCPVTYMETFSNQLPTMTARKLPQAFVMANITNGTTRCTHQYCPTTNHPTTPSALLQPTTRTVLHSYLQHTFLHLKDLLKPA